MSAKEAKIQFLLYFEASTFIMVTENIHTDLDITSARGEIVDIILHADEPPINHENSIVKLRYLPAYILVKLSKTRTTQLERLDECVIPIEARTSTYRIKQTIREKDVQRTVKRRQYSLTAAYAFTDYRAQGQTIPFVLVDSHSNTANRRTQPIQPLCCPITKFRTRNYKIA